MSKKIVDLSKWQKNSVYDWKAVKDSVDGVILRIGYRGYSKTGTLQTDITFHSFAKKCVENNIPFGVYWFAQEITESESAESANYIANILKDYKLSYPIYYDVEYSGVPDNSGRADKINIETRTKCVIAFCEEIKRLGFIPGVYSSESLFVELTDFEKIKKYNIWCAKYGKDSGNPESKPILKYDMWQYTSKGEINGISTKVDLSLDESTKKSIDTIVKEVLNGEWGNGITRETALIKAGYDYVEIQAKVNAILRNTEFNFGDKVKLKSDAIYSDGKQIPTYIKNSILYIRSSVKDNGDVVISTLKKGLITGVVNKKYLIKL